MGGDRFSRFQGVGSRADDRSGVFARPIRRPGRFWQSQRAGTDRPSISPRRTPDNRRRPSGSPVDKSRGHVYSTPSTIQVRGTWTPPTGNGATDRGLTRDGHDGHRDPGRARAQPPRRLARPAARRADLLHRGVSGSGKSSLAFDTLYAEGQRRYVESLSSYARQFLGQMPKPEVDRIDGLSPSISIQQKTGGRNPRSTVGTITEINDYLRVLFARVGQGHCPQLRPAGRGPDPRADRRADPRAARRAPRSASSPRSIRGPEGGIQGPVRRPRPRGLRPGAGRRPGRRAVGQPGARPADQARHRGRHRPAQGRAHRAGRGWPRRSRRRSKLGEGTVDRRARRASPTCSSRRTTPARPAGSASTRPARSCSASTARRGCARRATAWASGTTSTPTCSCPTRRCRSGTGRSSRSGRSRRWASGGGTSSKGSPPTSRPTADGPPKGAMLKGPWQRPRPEMAARLAARHGRPGDRLPLAEPGQALVARREVGGRRHRAARQVSRRRPAARPGPARAVHAEHDLPRLPGRAAQPPRPGRPRRRQDARRARRDADRPGRPVLRRPGRRSRPPTCPTRRSTPLDPLSRTIAEELLKEIRGRLGFLDERRPALPDARPRGADALRRRGPAHPAGEPGRRGAGRRALHPRRALDRPAPARQRPADRHPAAAPRRGQHRHRRRARRGHDARRRPPGRLRPRPRRQGGRGRRRRATWPTSPASAAEPHRPVPLRPQRDRGPGRAQGRPTAGR